MILILVSFQVSDHFMLTNQVMCLYCGQIAIMELKLAELRIGEVSTGDTQRSEARQTQKAIRTLEHKLNRVSHYHYQLITTKYVENRQISNYYHCCSLNVISTRFN